MRAATPATNSELNYLWRVGLKTQTNRADENSMNSPEQRLGARVATDGLWFAWDLDRRDRRGLIARLRDPARQQWGQVVDLSVSGAGIIAPRAEHLRRGSMLTVEAGGFKGMVAIHRIADTDDPGSAMYGISFVDFPPAFTDFVYSVLEAVRPAGLRDIWQRSR